MHVEFQMTVTSYLVSQEKPDSKPDNFQHTMGFTLSEVVVFEKSTPPRKRETRFGTYSLTESPVSGNKSGKLT